MALWRAILCGVFYYLNGKKSFEKGRIKKFSELVIHGAQLLQL